jgi:nicotinamidase-related amidase
MTISSLDPTVALIVIDLQNGVVGIDAAHPMEGVIARSAALAAAFRKAGLPVVLVNATGRAPGRTEAAMRGGLLPHPDPTGLIAELDVQPSDHLVSKQTWGAFHHTSLDAILQEHGVTQVVITGVATTAGVESTARAAYEHGYHVVLATDAMTDRSAEAHDHSVSFVFPRIGETGSTAEILALLGR